MAAKLKKHERDTLMGRAKSMAMLVRDTDISQRALLYQIVSLELQSHGQGFQASHFRSLVMREGMGSDAPPA